MIVIDAVETSEEPGKIIKFNGEDILQPSSMETSLHDVGIGQALQMARQ